MKKIIYFILFTASGCATSPRLHFVTVAEESAPLNPAPWSNGQVVTYWLGRTVVGADGNIFHEAHPVYRRENAGQPQLAVSPAVWGVPAATTNALQDQADALRAETARTRDMARQVVHAGEELLQQVKPIQAYIESNQQMQEQMRGLNQTTSNFNNRISLIESQVTTGSVAGRSGVGATSGYPNQFHTNDPVIRRP
jgi:hypothetical protein